ncbi:cupin domain-containing protein [Paenibacillus soyae]|uniref:Cupin domain-containing protein n=1 Tax=Paenibacillus soyae TaxID=2969249 RepID=A0A9X2MM54_9BACL|nr:cupin domain-containing protein [Paenibacillus soyae]MCR2802795.1 cupin domain-containing protein [Paenibacillus soyae]
MMEYIVSLQNGLPISLRGTNLVMAEWTAEGTPDGEEPVPIAPLHRHNLDDEAWYILHGTLGFQIGDAIMEAISGEAVIVPKGTPHTYWNPNPAEARYLIFMTPAINALIEKIHQTPQRDFEFMKRLFLEFDSELL